MPVESDADRESFFDEDEFATCVTTDQGTFTANFDDEFAAAVFSDGGRVNSSAPQLVCKTCDVERCSLNVVGARLDVMIKGVNQHFSVREHQPDGSGVSLLILDARE